MTCYICFTCYHQLNDGSCLVVVLQYVTGITIIAPNPDLLPCLFRIVACLSKLAIEVSQEDSKQSFKVKKERKHFC